MEICSLLFQNKMASQQVLQLWKSQVSHYQRIINRCVRSLTTPLTRFLPSDFEERTLQFKEILETREIQNYENFLDIIVHYIEGVKNKSNIQLADFLVQELGGKLLFWQNVILDVAENINYAGEATIWHIRKVFDERLYIDAANLSNYRKMSKICRQYLVALKNLVKYVLKFDIKKDSISKIDELFKKVKDTQSRYVHFTQSTQICESSPTMDDVSNNVSQWSRQNAIKNLFNFTKENKNVSEKSKNTLFNYNFKKSNLRESQEQAMQPSVNLKFVNQSIKGERLKSFQDTLKHLQNNSSSLTPLRQQFKNTKISKNTIKSQYFANIFDKDWLFSYQGFCVDLDSQKFCGFNQPYQEQTFINYEIDDEELMNELIGEDVDADTSMSDFSDISCNSFIVSDGHISDDQDADTPIAKPTYENRFGDKWVFSPTDYRMKQEKLQLENFIMIMFDGDRSLPLPVHECQLDENQKKLAKIVEGRDKKSILEVINKQNMKISKNKLDSFLRKYCSKCKANQNSSSKYVYKVKQDSNTTFNMLQVEENYEKENQSCKSKKSNKSSRQQSADIEFISQKVPNKFNEPHKISEDSELTTGEIQQKRRSSRNRSKRSKSTRS